MAKPNFAHDFVSAFVANRDEWVVVSQTVGGNTVVAHPTHAAVVKYGPGVTQGEANAQKHARLILDPAIIYVPEVYDFFYDDRGQVGYLIMERIDGVPIDTDSQTQILAIEAALNHLQSFSRDFPGPFHSGELQGVLWENSTPVTNNTVQSLEDWMNLWQDERVSLQEEEFVLCHLDTALKNMLYMRSGGLCLLDWASAGYYPRYFELVAHLQKGKPDPSIEKLLQSPRVPFSEGEERHIRALRRVCMNCMGYAVPRPKIDQPMPTRSYLREQPTMPNMS